MNHSEVRLTKGELKPKFRRIVKSCHPDVSSDPKSLEKFQDIVTRYQAAPLTRALVLAGFRVQYRKSWWLVLDVRGNAVTIEKKNPGGRLVRSTILLNKVEDVRCGPKFKYRMVQVPPAERKQSGFRKTGQCPRFYSGPVQCK
ncbi:MAG: hypothetical protein H0U18_03455 [Pyrinomonadaceae bacterium]|nr:hypothetical protein [Pyrinomonadaceae bacterium]